LNTADGGASRCRSSIGGFAS